MLEEILFKSYDAPDPTYLMICIVISLAIGAALAFIYGLRREGSKSLKCALVVLPAIVCVVIALVNGSVGAGVAVMGAFSLVRFRSMPGSARDISYIFLAMCEGLAMGMEYVTLALLALVVIGGALAIMQLATPAANGADEVSLRVTVPEDLDFTGMLDAVLARYASKYELASIKTAGMGSLYRLTYDLTLLPNANRKALIDEVRCHNGNLEVVLAHREVARDEL